MTEPDSSSRGLMIAAAVVALLLVVAIGLWLLSRSRSAPSVATVPIAPPRGPSVVQSPRNLAPGPPVTSQPAQPATPRGMPDDIRRYLSFLQGVEAQRKTYEGQLTNKMLAVVPNLLMPNFDSENLQPPDQQIVRQYDQLAQEYSQATLRFQAASQQVGVPMACRRLHGYYSAALSMNPRLISETARSLATGNYSGLLSMRGSVGKQIEENYQAADQELANICNQYGIRKPFDIGNSSGGGDVLLP